MPLHRTRTGGKFTGLKSVKPLPLTLTCDPDGVVARLPVSNAAVQNGARGRPTWMQLARRHPRRGEARQRMNPARADAELNNRAP